MEPSVLPFTKQFVCIIHIVFPEYKIYFHAAELYKSTEDSLIMDSDNVLPHYRIICFENGNILFMRVSKYIPV